MSIRAMNWAVSVIEESPDMSPKAASVLCQLAWFHNQETGRCDPSIARIRKRTKLTDRTIQRAITELSEMGLISVRFRQRKTKKSRCNLPNAYRFCWPRGWCHCDGRGGVTVTPNKEYIGRAELPSAMDDLIMSISGEDLIERGV